MICAISAAILIAYVEMRIDSMSLQLSPRVRSRYHSSPVTAARSKRHTSPGRHTASTR